MGRVINLGVETTFDEAFARDTTLRNRKVTGPTPVATSVGTGVTGSVSETETGLTTPITVTRDSGATEITFSASGSKIVASIASSLATDASLSAVARAIQTDGAGVLVPFTLTGVTGAGVLPFVPPPFTTAKFDGDSRTQGGGSRVVSGGSLTVGGGLGGTGSISLIQAVCGNKWLLDEGFQHAIGGSTTLGQEERSKSNAITSTGNPANTTTGSASDVKYSDLSDGGSSILTQPGSHVFSSSVSVNDNSGTAAAYYNTPSTAWNTLRTIARIADAMGVAGKVWYVGNEFPRGDAYYTMESRTVTGGTCTAANTTNFKDGESFGAVGVVGVFATGSPRPLAKVSSAPGQDQYTVTSGGVYTFGGTAPTTAFLNYNASPSGVRNGTYDQLRIVREWMTSVSPNYVSTINSVDYGIPGLLYQRPWIRIADTFNALLDTTTGASQLPKPGTSDVLQLHGLSLNAYLTAMAFKAKVDADYPTAPDLSTAPTRNNWWACSGNNSILNYSGTLPPTMRTGFTGTPAPTLISLNGVPIGKVNTSTGEITGTGIATGTLDFTTGVWSITLTATTAFPAASQVWFEQDIGNYNLDTMTEGTIGRNALNNPLMDMMTAVGTNLVIVNGVSSLSTVSNAQTPYGWTIANPALQTAINNGTATCSVVSGTDPNGFPHWWVELEGNHTAVMAPGIGSSPLPNFTARAATSGDKLISGIQMSYAPHGTIGRLYGCNGSSCSFTWSTVAVPRSSSTGTQNVTQMLSRTNDSGFGLYVDETVAEAAGGALSLYRLNPRIDTTGCTFSSPVLNLVAGRSIANVPVAYRCGFGRAQVRRRNDVV